ncbi:hypothetical protein QUF49_14430 [Fictibacillus sp. b24]|uniref:hypothetical protein n=1 Tax=Fictibacillus sp. b24 TaxID=3055863 RepID=UPI0025A2BB43|nr:hypothetical protein [Fictibacillus sp. b24]MDM5317202.1 hypothetical protein [Fictibacillus sp. b24]
MKRIALLFAALCLMLLGCNLLMEDDFNAYLDDRNKLINKEIKAFEEAKENFAAMMEDPNAKAQVEKSIEKYEALVKEAESMNFDKLEDLSKSQENFIKAIQSNAEGLKLSLSAFEKQDTALDEESYAKFIEAQDFGKKSETELEKFAEDNNFTLEETKTNE